MISFCVVWPWQAIWITEVIFTLEVNIQPITQEEGSQQCACDQIFGLFKWAATLVEHLSTWNISLRNRDGVSDNTCDIKISFLECLDYITCNIFHISHNGGKHLTSPGLFLFTRDLSWGNEAQGVILADVWVPRRQMSGVGAVQAWQGSTVWGVCKESKILTLVRLRFQDNSPGWTSQSGSSCCCVLSLRCQMPVKTKDTMTFYKMTSISMQNR